MFNIVMLAASEAAQATEKSGMPQLDTATFLPQIFWLVVFFAVLYLVMTYSAVPKISDVMEKRQNRIANDLEDAERLQREAEEARTAFETALSHARETAKSKALSQRDQIRAEMDAKYNELTARLNAEAEASEAAILAAKEKAMGEVSAVAGDLCKDIVSRIASLDLDDKAVAKAVEAHLAAASKEGANG